MRTGVIFSLQPFVCYLLFLVLFFLLFVYEFLGILCIFSESNSLSPPFFTGTNGTAQKGRPRKRKLMINHHQNDPLNLGTSMQMGMYFILFISHRLSFFDIFLP